MGAKQSQTPVKSTSALLDFLGRRARQESEQALGEFGLRPRHVVALTVLGNSGRLTQQELGRALLLDPSNLVAVLNDLESDDLIVRSRDPKDRRRHIVSLSAHGEATLRKAQESVAEAEAEMLGALTEDERDQLFALLYRATCAHRDEITQACTET